jgi:hypothetical protein
MSIVAIADVVTFERRYNHRPTSGYLHARPASSSGLKLDPGVFLRRR